jgi:hypothetical protein
MAGAAALMPNESLKLTNARNVPRRQRSSNPARSQLNSGVRQHPSIGAHE